MKKLFVLLLCLLPISSASAWKLGNNTNFFGDGSPLPFAGQNVVWPAMYIASTNTLWFSWEAWHQLSASQAPQRVVEAATLNLSTNTWSATAIAGETTLTNDSHGIPNIVRDYQNYEYVFYGAHNSPVKIDVTVNPDDPTAWHSASASGTPNEVTFPDAVVVGSNIFMFYSSTGAGIGLQETIGVIPATSSSGALSWGSAQTIFDSATSGNDGWLPIGQLITVGTKVHMIFVYGVTDGETNGTVYYAIYDTTNGTVCNYSGSTCIAKASQPISLSTLEANFGVYTSTGSVSGSPAFIIDGTGAAHLVVGDSTTLPPQLMHSTSASSSSAWSTPHSIFTYPSAVNVKNIDAGITLNAGGGVDAYFGDGAANYTYFSTGGVAGNMWQASRSATGSWSSNVEIRAMAAFGLDNPSAIVNAPAIARLMFAEETFDATTPATPNMRGWIWGDNGYVPRAGEQ